MRRVLSPLPFSSLVEGVFQVGVKKGFYEKRLKDLGLSSSDILIIGTIARSGTHFVMLLLANYIYLAAKRGECSPTLMNELFPNNWHIAYLNYHNIPFGPFVSKDVVRPSEDIKLIGVKEVTRSHSVFQTRLWKESRVLHLYRNPLDYAVSLYNYKHKKRPDLPNRLSSPSEVLEQRFDNYVAMYNSYRDAAAAGSFRILRLSYEELVSAPQFYLESILRWLGVEPDLSLIEKAVQGSSIGRIVSQEKEGHKVNPTAHGLAGSFVSSGQIGQWKKHFTANELSRWEKKFHQHNIDLNEFNLGV